MLLPLSTTINVRLLQSGHVAVLRVCQADGLHVRARRRQSSVGSPGPAGTDLPTTTTFSPSSEEIAMNAENSFFWLLSLLA